MAPGFVAPTPRLQASFIAAMAEFQAEGRGAADDQSMIGDEIRRYGAGWSDPERFAGFARQLRAEALEETPRPEGFVPCTTLWWADGDRYLGRLAIRHRLTPRLRIRGGHIGYDVRPSARRRGHATAMLRTALPLARRLGIERALLTCDADNVGSLTVIERSGGVPAGAEDGILRFWVPT